MGLLDLPAEILYPILELVVTANRAPPATIEEAERCCHPTPRWTDQYNCGLRVRAEETVPWSNSFALLSSCKLLAELTESVISDLWRQDRIVFSVDVLIVGEHELWPTWLCVPVAAASIDCLKVTIRIADGHRAETFDRLFGTEKVTCYRASGLFVGNGGPPLFLWAFHYLLQSFLQRGISLDVSQSTFIWEDAHNDRQLTVRLLHIDISTLEGAVLPPPEVANHDWLNARPRRAQECKAGAPELVWNLWQYCMRPTWLANFLSMGLHAMADESYGTLLVGRVGKIEIHADGE